MRVLVSIGWVALLGLLLAAGHTPSKLGAIPAKVSTIAVVPLEVGSTSLGLLAGGEARIYRFDLPAGVFAQIEVMQRGVDVFLVPRSADGQAQPTIDSPNGKAGSERAYLLGDGKGPVYLEVQNGDSGGPPGRYRLRVEALRIAGLADRSLVQAERDFAQAEGERRASTAISLKQAEIDFLALSARFEALENSRRIAEIFDRLGKIRNERDQAEGAKAAYQEAYRRFLALNLRAEAASSLDGLGMAYWLLGDSGRAIVCHEQALTLHKRLGDGPSEAASLVSLGRDWDLRGNVRQAFEAYDQAITIWRSTGDFRLGIALASRGRLYLTLGEIDLAEVDLLAARPFFETGPERELASLLIDLAEAGFGRGKEVRQLLDQALNLAQRFEDRRSEAVVLNLLGRTAVRRSEAKAAIDLHIRALDLFLGLGADREVAATIALLGQAELRAGRCRAALASFSKARSQLAAVGDRASEAAALLGQARARRCDGDPAQAESDIARVLEKIEKLSADVAGPGLRASMFADWREAYELAIGLAMARHAREPSAGHDRRALSLSERARARRLIESLSETGACEQPSPFDEILIVASKRAGGLGANSLPEAEKRRATLEFERLLAQRERYEKQCRRQRLPQAPPEWRKSEEGLDPAEFARILEPDTTLVEYSLGKEKSFVWWVHDGKIETAELPPRDQIEPIARHLRELIGSARPRTLRELIAKDLATLGRMLIDPLPRHSGIRRLLIVPDGDLFLVPFSALPLPDGDGVLVDELEVAMIPSVEALLAIRSRPRPKPELTLGILAAPTLSPAWPSLPWALREARTIRKFVPRSERIVAAGSAANREKFFQWPFQRVRFLHIATHAWFDAKHPPLSGLLLARRDGLDDLLHGFEIQQLHFAADLVVLSACETGLGSGREIRGEGLFGLAQSFLVAGSGSVMASLWPVHDQATDRLMELFYAGLLQQGLSPSAALRQAEIELRRQATWHDPYYWAGFVVFGEPTATGQ